MTPPLPLYPVHPSSTIRVAARGSQLLPSPHMCPVPMAAAIKGGVCHPDRGAAHSQCPVDTGAQRLAPHFRSWNNSVIPNLIFAFLVNNADMVIPAPWHCEEAGWPDPRPCPPFQM